MEKQKLRLMRVKRKHILARLLLSLAAVVILLPVVLTALYSFFSPNEIKAFMQTRGSFDAASLMEIKLSPNMFSLSQYYKILIEDMTILRYFVNSAMYTAAILFGQALLIPAMAYALSRFKFRGRDALFFVVIMLMLLPFQVTMVPNVITLRAMGLLDTIWAIILPMTVAPFYIFLLRQYMVGLPGEMIEAAQIDGAGTFRCFIHVVLPVCQPILGAALFSAAVDMTANYRATTSTTLLPASAVRGSGDSRYVYVVTEECNALGQRVLKVKKLDVKVLSEVGSTVSIQDDLSRQRVAYMEDRTISDGSEVMVYGE